MAVAPKNPELADVQDFEVLRAICMHGERVEVGATVQLTRAQGIELAHAGKVKRADPAAAKAEKPAKVPKAEKPAAPVAPVAPVDATPADLLGA